MLTYKFYFNIHICTKMYIVKLLSCEIMDGQHKLKSHNNNKDCHGR